MSEIINSAWYEENLVLRNELAKEYPAVHNLLDDFINRDKRTLKEDTIRFFDRFSSAIVLFEIMDTEDVLNNLHRLTNNKDELNIVKKFLLEYKEYIEKE